MTSTVISILAIGAVLFLAGMAIGPTLFGSPWCPISKKRLRRALRFCGVQPGEHLVDLGSGDGRVLITAAQEFGLRGTGIEIDPAKVWFSRYLVRRAGIQDKVRFVRTNLFHHDYRDADILFIHLTHQAMDKLFPALLDHLKPTVKILSYKFCIQGMTPDKVTNDKKLFLYTLSKGGAVNQYR